MQNELRLHYSNIFFPVVDFYSDIVFLVLPVSDILYFTSIFIFSVYQCMCTYI